MTTITLLAQVCARVNSHRLNACAMIKSSKRRLYAKMQNAMNVVPKTPRQKCQRKQRRKLMRNQIFKCATLTPISCGEISHPDLNTTDLILLTVTILIHSPATDGRTRRSKHASTSWFDIGHLKESRIF
ncbi:hypothetical protein I7I50_10570 [Histoplasma capsulatum G186AR]|uniref:Uncharacterized protein n=1 Tax=Ajellomyces capsulatus TaxID=5037 RepID=A0A8H8D6H6_AJECA|nr:hypothetical protein I7I52_01809 [Histoplasma capsulatum]QSS69321.1 hypothetical protein I7I50_10570 [Histoplasma capsulatum G186AR]